MSEPTPPPSHTPAPALTPAPVRPRGRLHRLIFGTPRNIQDPHTYHSISLIAFLAWVGLGADGLSSSAYGPDESFRAIGQSHYLGLALALATTFTVCVIAIAYSGIIKRFPFGGGGYVVASRLLGQRFGVVSGSALLVDYVLTISVSIADGADQIFSFLPHHWIAYKLWVEVVVICLLVLMNLRGVKESVTILTPVFALFLVCHAVLIFGAVGSHVTRVPELAGELHHDFSRDLGMLGMAGMIALFLRAYSMGAGTYTGIEAVSNGLMIMREPKVETARRTMLYMAVSLSITAGGILLAYMLFHVAPVEGKTMNAVLLDKFAGAWRAGSIPLGTGFVWVTLASEAALLFVAAQAGFLDGPRVMSTMATDSYFPHRFAQLSDRLTMQDGVLLMGGASLAILFYTGGDVGALVTMYSINVFVTFSLSQASMLRYWWQKKKGPEAEAGRKRGFAVHGIAFVLCFGILVTNLYEKMGQGGWITVLVTTGLVVLCLVIRRHYQKVQASLKRLDEIMNALPASPTGTPVPLDPKLPTAVMLVGGYGGLGIHALLTVQRLFPGHFKNYIFVSVGVIDSATMKGVEEVEEIRQRTEDSLKRYVDLAKRLGLAADYRMSVGTEAVTEAEKLCVEIGKEFPRCLVFAGKLVFQEERWFQRLLHNETAYQLQRRLQFAGLNAMVLPVRVMTEPAAA